MLRTSREFEQGFNVLNILHDRYGLAAVVPSGSVEKAQVALELLKSAVLELAQANPDGITNSDTAKTLGLQSNYLVGSNDYLSWSLLGLLVQEGKMVRGDHKKHKATVK